MNNAYKVSLITPVYNVMDYLEAAYRSVKQQTMFSQLEWIMVDDCSTDGSYEYICALSKKHLNIKALQTPANSGSASLPRNMALETAKADYIMFLDADDVLRPNAVEVLYNLIACKDVGLADAAFIDMDSGQEIEGRYLGKREGLYSIVDDTEEWFAMLHPLWTKIYRKALIEQNAIRFDTALRNGEDTLFLFQYMRAAKTAWHVHDVIYEYRILDASLSHNRDFRYYMELAKSTDAVADYLVGTELQRYYERYIEEIVFAALGILCDSENVSDEECGVILPHWYRHVKYIADHALDTKTPLGEILARAAKRDDRSSYIGDFFSLRKLFAGHRQFAKEVFTSRGWRLITAVNKILGRIK